MFLQFKKSISKDFKIRYKFPMVNFNLPNILSVLRLLISPLAGFVLFKGYLLVATFLYLALALSDFLDGFIARKTQNQTPLGAILDPLADKFLVFSYILALWLGEFKYQPDTLVIILLLLKELVVVVGFFPLWAAGKTPRPNLAGKVSTALLFIYGVVLLLCNLGLQVAIFFKPYLEVLINGTLLLALLLYLRAGVRAFLKIS
ncbi:MAG TPA: CDP-alcohol phosphatidyltransferase family protein [Aquifex aeolicus]|nr:CDP-alcohol phosphatidyltransferase family protein [Aquificales bacterium]HIQ25853.1 CDP-alcohol phosphatidyltransferase family protein [Aquifex aeolicus]